MASNTGNDFPGLLDIFLDKNMKEIGDVSLEVSKPIGSGFSWAICNKKAHFPNVTLTGGRSWVNEETKNLFENAEINIITIGVNPPEVSS